MADTSPSDAPQLGFPLPPLLFLSCLFAGGLLQFFRPLPFVPGLEASLCFALPLFAAAVLLGVSGLKTMKRAGTPHHPAATPRALVTSGPFRHSRNPLYLALLLVLTGFAFLLDSVWLVISVPLLLLLLNTLVVPREEATLAALFGAEYDGYRHRVRRWL